MIQIGHIIRCFPFKIYQMIDDFLKQDEINVDSLEEIRIRVNKPIIIKMENKEEIIEYQVKSEEILEILQYICDNSIYSYQGQICNGYITMKGGHRVGISGSVVMKEGKVVNVNYISSLNFRIAKQVIGCSNKILKYVLNPEENTVYNTLIVSPPRSRKDHYIKRFNKKNKQWNRRLIF